jgi:hypothetical protein
MAHRRSGAKRRSIARRSKAEESSSSLETNATANTGGAASVSEAPLKEPNANSGEGRSRSSNKPQPLKPTASDVVAAVASLYLDQLKPFGRILRKRIAERHVASDVAEPTPEAASLGLHPPVEPPVNVPHLKAVCEECATLKVEPEEGGDWSVTLSGCPASFIDIYDSIDVYPEELWRGAAKYFENAPEEDTTLPGGRYSCARTLLLRGLPFLEKRSLGQVCHIVQLAIADRKLLGYLNGAVVPYKRSQSMMKEKCASQKSACENMCAEAASLEFASWVQARKCMKSILAEAAAAAALDGHVGPGVVPLSNIKRTFRSEFQLELSETVLGHSKLSELLQDDRFQDICAVELEKHGYIVVQRRAQDTSVYPLSSKSQTSPKDQIELPKYGQYDGPSAANYGSQAEDPAAAMAPEIFDLGFGTTPVGFGPTPLPSPEQTNREEEPSFLTQLLPLYLQESQYCRTVDMTAETSCARQFCPGEPLRLEDVGDMTSASHYFGAVQPPTQPYVSGGLPLMLWDDMMLCSMMQHTMYAASLAPVEANANNVFEATAAPTPALKKQFFPDETPQLEDCGTVEASITDKEKKERRYPAQPQWPSLSPWKDGKLEGMVRNTFIHTSMTSPTLAIGSRQRSMSLGHTHRRKRDSGTPKKSNEPSKNPLVISLSEHLE